MASGAFRGVAAHEVPIGVARRSGRYRAEIGRSSARRRGIGEGRVARFSVVRLLVQSQPPGLSAVGW